MKKLSKYLFWAFGTAWVLQIIASVYVCSIARGCYVGSRDTKNWLEATYKGKLPLDSLCVVYSVNPGDGWSRTIISASPQCFRYYFRICPHIIRSRRTVPVGE